MKRKKVSGFADMNTGDNKTKRPDELVDLLHLNEDFVQVRIIGQPAVYAQHWISIETPNGKKVNIPRTVPNFDPATDSFDDTISDPYKNIPNDVSTRKMYFVNVIVRDDQDDRPRKLHPPTRTEKKSGYKSKDSKAWTPVKVLRMPTSVVRDIQRIITMNKHKVEGRVREFELSHPVYGCDIFISFDKSAAGSAMYSVQKGDKSKLTKEEKAYLVWNLNGLIPPSPSIEEVKRDAKALSESATASEDDDDDDDDFIESMDKKQKEKRSKKKKRKPSSDDDDSKVPRRKKKRKKRRVRD